ncbi:MULTISPECIES: hypothetical protein [Sulfurospirillum]|uniref:Outer membrane porin n=4 Tax=Sulfurospirillum TaxID=57665 RepID=A0A1Y0HN33_9BACT|nr:MULTISPECIES: hypothetical protein [Sulfurospirillum]AHJ12777.1 outer membrane porin [Sulfurospirillum multivorans DSM 12446]AOO65255.1 outer membrane porin [Sulfurospirillum halorespirans DSM 13726]ARU48735.1 hypothetical protein Sdiek1_1572 [Sulfurospirillum diekertiae]ASC93558.1 hypothetical protein Sdiek2_1540 [Sulfurospirillum diekertiae]ATB69599.1 outer membrane porin [Sulfurospirillum diekertiae]
MKLAKLSLATLIAMSSVVYGADTLEDAFKNGKVNGEIRAFYFGRDYDAAAHGGPGATDSSLMAFGLRLSYEDG